MLPFPWALTSLLCSFWLLLRYSCNFCQMWGRSKERKPQTSTYKKIFWFKYEHSTLRLIIVLGNNKGTLHRLSNVLTGGEGCSNTVLMYFLDASLEILFIIYSFLIWQAWLRKSVPQRNKFHLSPWSAACPQQLLFS